MFIKPVLPEVTHDTKKCAGYQLQCPSKHQMVYAKTELFCLDSFNLHIEKHNINNNVRLCNYNEAISCRTLSTFHVAAVICKLCNKGK